MRGAKIGGYILSVLGIVGIVGSGAEGFRSFLSIPSSVSNQTVLIAGSILFVLGIALLVLDKRGKSQPSEVPIYEGKNVVGFRRLEKR